MGGAQPGWQRRKAAAAGWPGRHTGMRPNAACGPGLNRAPPGGHTGVASKRPGSSVKKPRGKCGELQGAAPKGTCQRALRPSGRKAWRPSGRKRKVSTAAELVLRCARPACLPSCYSPPRATAVRGARTAADRPLWGAWACRDSGAGVRGPWMQPLGHACGRWGRGRPHCVCVPQAGAMCWQLGGGTATPSRRRP